MLNSMTMLIFFFFTNGTKGHFDENEFCHCDGSFFETDFLKLQLFWNQSYAQSSFQQSQGKFTIRVEDFTNMDQGKC